MREKVNNQDFYSRAKQLIPGGTQLLSKRPEMFAPNLWPSYFSKAKGVEVWDLEGNCYLDMSIMGVGACILGYADDDVDARVIEAIKQGINSSLNCFEEVHLAEKLIELHPWFDSVRYCRSGGEAMSIAVRIARAHSKRDVVLFSGYHGWCDWYLAANLGDDSALDGQLMPGLEPLGVPRSLVGTSAPFDIQDLDSLRSKILDSKGEVGVIVLEPARGVALSEQVLLDIRKLCDEHEIVLIYDEITSGFRSCTGGLHRNHQVKPDIAVLAKSLANGYPMAAILGTGAVMSAAEETFISSTNWTDRTGPVAALATIDKYVSRNVGEHISRIGAAVQEIWQSEGAASQFDLEVAGIPSLPAFSFLGEATPALDSLFVTLMLEEGILGFRQFKPSLAHNDTHVERYAKAFKAVLKKMSMYSSSQLRAVEPSHRGFYRLTR